MNKTRAVEMVRKIRDKENEETQGKTKEELKRHYHEKASWIFTQEPEGKNEAEKEKSMKSRP